MSLGYFAYPYSNMKFVTQMRAKFLCQFSRARREQVNILAHARLWHISIDRLRAKNNRVIAAAQKFQNRFLNGCKRQGFAHDELLKR